MNGNEDERLRAMQERLQAMREELNDLLKTIDAKLDEDARSSGSGES